jgi:hypothetical protein
MKIQPDFCVLVLLLFYHQRRSLAQLTVDILKFEDNQKTLDNASVLATYSFPTGFSNPLDWFIEPYTNIPSDSGLIGLLYHPVPHNACTLILEQKQRDCASVCNTSSTNLPSGTESPFRALMNGLLFNLSRIALVDDYHVCTGKKLKYTQVAGFDGLITFTGDNENRNINNRVYDNTAKMNVDVVASQFPVAVVSKTFAQTLIQNATYECTTQSGCEQWQLLTVVRVKGDSTRQGWIQVGIGIGLVIVVIGVPLITCIVVCICCVWCCTSCKCRKRYSDDDELGDDDAVSYGCCARCKDCCVQSCEKCNKFGVYEVHELQHQVLGPSDDEIAGPVRSAVRQSSRREEFLRERDQSLHNLRRSEGENEAANSQFRRTYETSMFNEREFTESEKAKESSKTCAICLCEFEVDEKVCALPCDDGHIFHTKCIEQWLETNSVCPVCRTFIALPNH